MRPKTCIIQVELFLIIIQDDCGVVMLLRCVGQKPPANGDLIIIELGYKLVKKGEVIDIDDTMANILLEKYPRNFIKEIKEIKEVSNIAKQVEEYSDKQIKEYSDKQIKSKKTKTKGEDLDFV